MKKYVHPLNGLSLLALMVASQPALAKTEISPWIEVDQTVTAQLKGGDEVLTYTSASAGVDVMVDTKRTQAQLNYQYEHRFSWDDNMGDQSVHTGLARVTHQLVPNAVNIEAGAVATRFRTDNRGAAPALLLGDEANVTQVYSAYAGPSVSQKVGALEVNASYRLGYTIADDTSNYVPPPGQPRADKFENSVSHNATASVGMRPDDLPFGWSVSAGWEREDASQLDQRFENRGVRGDVVVPVTQTLALVGGVGYEDIEVSQRPPLLDGAGNPVVDSSGRYVENNASPRLSAYDFDGMYWDVGAVWKPSERTNLGVHVGRRYDSWTYNGALSWQIDQHSALNVSVYDQVETFGQQLTDGLALLPTSFQTTTNSMVPQFSGCIFGGASAVGSGGCLSGAYAGLNGAAFRQRGITGTYSRRFDRLRTGIGLGYNQRRYKTPVFGGGTILNGVTDETWFANANMDYTLTSRSGIDANGFLTYAKSGIGNAPDVLSAGATASYYYNIGRRLSAHAGVGLYSYEIEGIESDMTASGQVGLRYSF